MVVAIRFLNLKIVFTVILLFLIKASGFSQNKGEYTRFVDSADVYIDISSKKAQLFLDSISKPIEEHIEGRLADYYSIKALIYEDANKHAKMHQSYILANKYADIEGNCIVGGQVNLELFSATYFIKGDSTAYKYLETAKQYFESCDYDYGLLEVKQMYCYAEFIDKNYEVCNEMILKDLQTYKDAKEDAYFYLFATFMLVCNYLELDDYDKARMYLKEFESLENNSSISKYNYLSFEAEINLNKAYKHYDNKVLDSTHFYLKKVTKSFGYLTEDLVRSSYNLYSDYYKSLGNINASQKYIDSLLVFENKILNNNINASIDINESLYNAEQKLKATNEKSAINQILILSLVGISILLSTLYFYSYKKNRFKLNGVSSEVNKLTYLKSNNEKLTVKVQGLEEYINNLKQEVKEISKLDGNCLREGIRAFYTNLHHNSTTIFDKTNNHLELVNDLNADFFNELNEKFPQLNNSEIIICYYIYIGFKNKEIAVFLNSSVRAIESKRYRITKKMNLEKITLSGYLNETF